MYAFEGFAKEEDGEKEVKKERQMDEVSKEPEGSSFTTKVCSQLLSENTLQE